MSEENRLKVGFAALGLAIGAALFTYLEFTNYAQLNAVWLGVSVVFCPPSLLSMLFMDIEPHTVEAVVAWSVVGLLNSALYAAIGAVVAKYLWRSDRPRTNQGIPLH